MAALYERTLNEQTLTFMLNDEGAIVDEETGSRWNFFGEAIAGELEGEQLRQLQAFPISGLHGRHSNPTRVSMGLIVTIHRRM
jgi:hypothetical protein